MFARLARVFEVSETCAAVSASVEPLEPRSLLSGLPALVKDIRPAAGDSSPAQYTNVNGTLFFAADDGVNGTELWKSDGTTVGTVLVKNINTAPGLGSQPSNLVNVNGTLFFTARDAGGIELWKSDGTAAGTVRVKDIFAGAPDSHARFLTNVNGVLYFVADDGVHGAELWRSNGTLAGTVLLRDVQPTLGESNIAQLTSVNNRLFFVANDGLSGPELWISDGSVAGTIPVADIRPGVFGGDPRSLMNVNGTLYFAANDGTTGHELWRTDGTVAGTTQVRDILGGFGGSSPNYLTNVNGTLFFWANDGTSGLELWKSNGTSNGTVLVKDVRAGAATSGAILSHVNANGTLYFVANDGVAGFELWKSNGTTVGTVLVKDIRAGSITSLPGNLTNVGDLVYFRASDGIAGTELWRTDGSALGTVLVDDLVPAGDSSDPLQLTTVGETLFFSATAPGVGRELLKVLPPPRVQMIDDGQPGFSVTGSWSPSTTGRDGDVRYAVPGTGGSVASWTFTGLSAGLYRVATTWPPAANRPNNAPYRIRESANGPDLRTIAVNQRVAPVGFADQGSQWQDLGVVAIDGAQMVVQLSNNTTTGYSIADAVRIERVPSYVIDNSQPGYTQTGAWIASTGGLGNNVRYANVGIGESVASWTFLGLKPGQYTIAATWPPHPNRAVDAPYRVRETAGGANLLFSSVNQRQSPGQFAADGALWRTLGTVTITGIQVVVQLTNNTGSGIVIADAVRLVRGAPPPPPPVTQPSTVPAQTAAAASPRGVTPTVVETAKRIDAPPVTEPRRAIAQPTAADFAAFYRKHEAVDAVLSGPF